MKYSKTIKFTFGFMFISLLLPQSAFAYMDPGTGSYIFQIIIAFVLGGLFTIKQYWKKIIGFFKKS